MNKELQDKLDEFINDFLNVPSVKQYLLLKEEIASSKEIELLKENLKNSQKNMALSLGKPEYNTNKELYLKAKEEYENHPLIINYNVLIEEVRYLLDELKDKLK